MEYIPRILEQDILPRLKNKKILFLLGARRVGKTTLMRHLLNGRSGSILNMDAAIDRDKVERAAALEPEDGIRTLTGGELLIIDEAQRMKDIGRITKGWFDRDVSTKILLLGSASANLLDVAAGELVGRNEKAWLTPLLFREILAQQDWFRDEDSPTEVQKFFGTQVRALLMERITYGMYPEAYQSAEPVEYLTELASDYLFKDVFGAVAQKSTEDVKSLLVELAREVGETVSYLQLATRLKISRQTVRRYLQLLEESFIIFSLPAYATDPDKEMHRSYKYYFWDTGVRNALLREWGAAPERSDMQVLWKNWVMAEIKKLSVTFRRQEELFFWQSRNGSTVDLVIKQGGALHPFDFHFYPDLESPSRAFDNMYKQKAETIHPENVLEVLL